MGRMLIAKEHNDAVTCDTSLLLHLCPIGRFRLDLGLVPHEPPLGDVHLPLLAHSLSETVLEGAALALLVRCG